MRKGLADGGPLDGVPITGDPGTWDGRVSNYAGSYAWSDLTEQWVWYPQRQYGRNWWVKEQGTPADG